MTKWRISSTQLLKLEEKIEILLLLVISLVQAYLIVAMDVWGA
jgi:hypothetical protein